jgi:hypothetical protein
MAEVQRMALEAIEAGMVTEAKLRTITKALTALAGQYNTLAGA